MFSLLSHWTRGASSSKWQKWCNASQLLYCFQILRQGRMNIPTTVEVRNLSLPYIIIIPSNSTDLALDILEKHPRLAVTSDKDGVIPLYALGQTPSLFKSGSQLWFWQRWTYLCEYIFNFIFLKTIQMDKVLFLFAQQNLVNNIFQIECSCQKIKYYRSTQIYFYDGFKLS